MMFVADATTSEDEMTQAQAWFLIVEVGIIALVVLLRALTGRP
jgi:hypothetical protein